MNDRNIVLTAAAPADNTCAYSPRVLRVVSWNCSTGLVGKLARLAAFNADILIVPECSQKDADHVLSQQATGGGWIGATPRKGLGVFTYHDVRGVVVDQVDESVHYVLPVAISGPLSFHLLGVWSYRGAYRPGVWTYSDHLTRMSAVYAPFLAEAPSVCIGDFNSNAIWDRPKSAPHANLVEAFARLGMRSVYHSRRREAQGSETEATFYFWRQRARTFHIDHCFVSDSLLQSGCSLSVGKPDEWLSLSDHMPLVLEIALPSLDPQEVVGDSEV